MLQRIVGAFHKFQILAAILRESGITGGNRTVIFFSFELLLPVHLISDSVKYLNMLIPVAVQNEDGKFIAVQPVHSCIGRKK